MTEEQIIKALECCMDRENKNCREADCPFYKFCLEDLDALQKASLDLIKRQKEEIERLKQQRDSELVMCIANDKNKIKSEAIKELAERVKDYFREKAIETFGDMADSVEYLTIDTKQTEIDLDNLVKEMEEYKNV